jgi:tetratricopeptide (TPR) repeat protein
VYHLGHLYTDLERYDEAEKIYRRALKGYKKALSPEHILTLDMVYYLGHVYIDLVRYDEAKKMYQQALQGYKTALGEDVVKTYISVLNMAKGLTRLLKIKSRVKKAKELYFLS